MTDIPILADNTYTFRMRVDYTDGTVSDYQNAGNFALNLGTEKGGTEKTFPSPFIVGPPRRLRLNQTSALQGSAGNSGLMAEKLALAKEVRHGVLQFVTVSHGAKLDLLNQIVR